MVYICHQSYILAWLYLCNIHVDNMTINSSCLLEIKS